MALQRLRALFRNSRRCGLAALSFLLSGCSLVDSFGPRAVEYNQQTADSKSTQILLNVMRAAYTYPLQFTDLSTVTGQAVSQIAVTSSLPFWGARGTSSRLYTFSPGFTFSGGPSFNIANLNSQEFYSGIQTQVDPKIIQHYLFAGYDPRILFPLFISEIATDNQVLRNTVTTKEYYYTFYSAILELVNHGLSMEQVKSTTPVGPILTNAQASDPKLLAGLVSASATSTSTSDSSATLTLKRYVLTQKDDPNLTDSERADLEKRHVSVYYRLVKNTTSYKFCFDLRTSRPYPFGDFSEQVGDTPTGSIKIPLGKAYGKDVFIPILEPVICGKPTPTDKIGANATIKLRSVEEIFLFLGDIARTELGLSGSPPTTLAVPVAGFGYLELFRVERRAPTPGDILATLNDETYVISPDPSGRNASTTVAQLLTDLLALSSSAKSLPAPNVIPFFSSPPG
jgi:hypothetical protein